MRELKRIVVCYGMEWHYYEQDEPIVSRSYEYVHPKTGWMLEIMKGYVASILGGENYWVVVYEGRRVCKSKTVRGAMKLAKGILMSWDVSNNGQLEWCTSPKADGVVHYLMKGYAPYVQVAPHNGGWYVKDITTTRRHVVCDSLEEAKGVAIAWVCEKELER